MMNSKKMTRAAACLISILVLLLTCCACAVANFSASDASGETLNVPDTVYLRAGTQTDMQEVILTHGGQESSVLTLTQGVDYDVPADISLIDTFSDVMGMSGFILQRYGATGALRTYYTVVNGNAVDIAVSFGPPIDDTVLDLDGDGITELICNVQYNADGVRRALVYRLMDDGIYEASATELLDVPFDDRGVGATWSYYDAARNVVEIHYAVAGQTEYAARDYPLELDRLTFAFVTSVASEAGLSASDNAQRLAFGKVLWDIYQRGTLPDGHLLEYSTLYSMEVAENSTFAITDVDGDGQDELIILWETASMAGMQALIFGYDGGEVYVELREFPSLTFYDNGIVTADWSHNQGLSGRFWPYFVYRWDKETDVYQSFGFVAALDKHLLEENEIDEPFPTDIDVDGDGLVYYILPANWDGRFDGPTVDGPDYEAWRNTFLDGAKERSIPFQKMTEENIAALGYPKPDVQYPEPAG